MTRSGSKPRSRSTERRSSASVSGSRATPRSPGWAGPVESAVSRDAARPTPPTAAVPEADRGGGLAEFGGASADEPERLPWLIRLDEFVEDQTYMGYEDFVVRSNNTETAMNEAVTLALAGGGRARIARGDCDTVRGERPRRSTPTRRRTPRRRRVVRRRASTVTAPSTRPRAPATGPTAATTRRRTTRCSTRKVDLTSPTSPR